ncbi:hypothetical protein TNCV_4429681 [Trichonephila clavipes]|nr:hypothetical protein TNCV_4429681 [Trichonephila clavipes]
MTIPITPLEGLCWNPVYEKAILLPGLWGNQYGVPLAADTVLSHGQVTIKSRAKSQLQSCAIRTNTFLSRYINQAALCVDSPFRHGPGEGRTLNVTPGAVSQDAALFANEQSEN